MSAIDLAVNALKATPAVVAITTLSRIYPIAAPEGQTLAYCVVNLASDNDEQMLAGKAGMYKSRIQVDCIAPNAAVALALADAVNGALEERKPSHPVKLTDCYKDGIGLTDYSDDRSAVRRVIGFHIEWRA